MIFIEEQRGWYRNEASGAQTGSMQHGEQLASPFLALPKINCEMQDMIKK